MEMQIPLLRKLFEARIGQISTIFAQDPPKGLGAIEPVLRGLKGYLFALEGMHRSDYLHGLPFTAVQELGQRVDEAVESMKALPDTLSRQNGMDLLHTVDSLHRLCLQENLMAGGMDASKLGKLTVILEHKLGDVLKTIESVGSAADGHTERIQQSVEKCLQDIQGVYNSQTELIQNSASLANESINSQAEGIRKRQEDVTGTLEETQKQLDTKRTQFQESMDEKLASAWALVDEAHTQQQAAGQLLHKTTAHLKEAEVGIKALDEITQTANAASQDLQNKMTEGAQVIETIRQKLQDGSADAEKLTASLTQAKETQAGIEQLQAQCAEFTTEARQRQTEAIEAASQTAATAKKVLQQAKQKCESQAQAYIGQMQAQCDEFASQAQEAQTQAIQSTKQNAAIADQMLHEAQQKLDSQFETAVRALAKISARNASAGEAVENIEQQQQAANQSAQAAAESNTQAGDQLAKLQELAAQGQESAGTIKDLLREGGDMKLRLADTLAQAGQASERIAQLETEASEASAAIGQGKAQAIEAVEKVLADSDKQQRQFTLAISEHRQAAQDAVAALRSDQTLAAEMLERTQQDIEALQGDVTKVNELRTSAMDAEAHVRQKRDQSSELTGQLGTLLGAAGEVKTQVDAHLTASAQARQKIDKIQETVATDAEDLKSRQEEALASVLSEAETAKTQRQKSHGASSRQLQEAQNASAKQLQEAQAALDQQLQASKTACDEQLEEVEASFSEQFEEAQASFAELYETSKTASDQQLTSAKAGFAKQLNAVQTASTEQFTAAKKAFDQQLKAAGEASSTQLKTAKTAFDQQLQTATEASATQLQTAETAFAEQFEAAKTAAEQQLESAKISTAKQLEAARNSSNRRLADAKAASAQQFEETAAANQQQLQDAQTASAEQLTANQTAADEQLTANQTAADEQLTANQTASDEQLTANQTAADEQLTANQTAADEQLAAASSASTQQLGSARKAVDHQLQAAKSSTAQQLQAAQTAFDEQLEGARSASAQQLQTAEESFAEQLESAKASVGEIEKGKIKVDNIIQQTRQHQDEARQAGDQIAQVRVETAEALGDIQAKVQEGRTAATDLVGLLAAGTESRSKIDSELTAAGEASGQIAQIKRDVTQALDQTQQQQEQIAACVSQSNELVEQFQTNADGAIDNLNRQTADLVDRNEQLQQEIEDLFGQAADGGLFRQFEDLAEQCSPERAKWFKLLIITAGGGGAGLALITIVLAAFSSVAAWTVLLAGLVPMGFFLYFCTIQYNTARRSETDNQYRAALSRSMTAYRKLLSSMQAEGIADSPFVDRMLSMLFSQPNQQPEPMRLAGSAIESEPETIDAPVATQIDEPEESAEIDECDDSDSADEVEQEAEKE